jgi:hypothetical protein
MTNMGNEAWRRGYSQGQKFVVPRIDDFDIEGDVTVQRDRTSSVARAVAAILGAVSLVVSYGGLVFLVGYALGADLSYRNAVIIAGCFTIARMLDAAVMRNAGK